MGEEPKLPGAGASARAAEIRMRALLSKEPSFTGNSASKNETAALLRNRAQIRTILGNRLPQNWRNPTPPAIELAPAKANQASISTPHCLRTSVSSSPAAPCPKTSGLERENRGAAGGSKFPPSSRNVPLAVLCGWHAASS